MVVWLVRKFGKMEERYEALKELGSGNFGVARLVRDKKTKELVAVKYIERGKKVIFLFCFCFVLFFFSLCDFILLFILFLFFHIEGIVFEKWSKFSFCSSVIWDLSEFDSI